jgi:hypothetical protein
MSTRDIRIVRKTIFRIFILRVSGKGDEKGSANQLEVLKQYEHIPDVALFLKLFEVEMMKASSRKGQKLRRQWQMKYDLKILTRNGRNDFLGISVVVGASRFICYASTAAGMDEANGNAFTRHVCEAIADPAFHGLADPEFMARRDAGEFDNGEHPSLVHAFDPTRFVRTMSSANDIYDVAVRDRAAFEAKDLHIDPADGPHARMMWMFLAYGSEVESVIGRQRRFVGRLNKARAGFFPYREGAVPLGGRRVPVPGMQETYRLDVDDQHIASVTGLQEIGLDVTKTNSDILDELAKYGVTSGDPKTLGVPVDQLDPAAAKRFFVRRKLEAYRDGELELEFVGVTENHFRVGSGHILTRRWEGLDANGQPDRLGSITFRLRFRKPTVTGPDGQPRKGWIDGITDEEERARWNRLIALRGVDDAGRRSLDELEEELTADLPDDLARHLQQELERARRRSHGGRPAERVVSAISSPWRTDHDEDGVRMFTRLHATRAQGCSGPTYNVEVFEESGPPGRNGGIRRKAAKLRATFREHDATAAVAGLITEGVRILTDRGYSVGRHRVTLSSALTEQVAAADPTAERAAQEKELQEQLISTRQSAKGYDKTVSVLRGQGLAENDPQLESAIEDAEQEWTRFRAFKVELDDLQRSPLPQITGPVLPALDVSDPRDLVVGLLGPYATGTAPEAFLDALHITVPNGARYEPGVDGLQWHMVGDVVFTTTTGETITLEDVRVPVENRRGRGGGGAPAAGRAADMAARRMRDGQPITAIPAAGSAPAQISRTITDHLRRTGRFPDDALLAAAIDCPIPDTTRILWEHATGTGPAKRTAFARHIVAVFTGALRESGRRTGQGTVWAYDIDVDRRLDQLTIVAAALDRAAGVRADGLTAVLDPADPRSRRVLDASAPVVKVNAVYPPALRRLPAPGHPDGWGGRGAASLDAEHKRIGLLPCPYDDCAESYATVLVPAVEVLALGAMMICRRCSRAATPTRHPMFAAARRIRFPHAYIAWFDAQPRRTGQVVACVAPGCRRDIGLGAGNTWQWDDVTGPAWHDDDCRAGQTSGTHTRCAHLDCTLNEGAGPGSIRQEGRGRRRWHSRACEQAENRRLTASKVEYAPCRLTGCTLDEGGGPGSIRKGGKHRTVHNESCRHAVKHGSNASLIRRWARAHGHDVPDTGRLPGSVIDAYRAATAAGRTA